MTHLKSYLIANKIKQAEFARSVGVSCGYMSELVNGEKTPGLELALRIEDVTRRAVSAGSWRTAKTPEGAKA